MASALKHARAEACQRARNGCLHLTIGLDSDRLEKMDKVMTVEHGCLHPGAVEIANSVMAICKIARMKTAGHAFLTTCVQNEICGQTLVNFYEALDMQLAPTICLMFGINTGLLSFARVRQGSAVPVRLHEIADLHNRLLNGLPGYRRLHAIAAFHDDNVRQRISWHTRPERRSTIKTRDDFPQGVPAMRRRLRKENPALH